VNIILFEKDELLSDGTTEVKERRFIHLKKVLKVNTHDIVRVGVINKLMGEGKVLEIKENSIRIHLKLNTSPPPPLPITLLLAMPRPKAFRRILETATTMGIKRIVLFHSYNVEKSYWDSPFLSVEAMRERMLFGLEQAIDTILPTIELYKNFNQFINECIPTIIKNTVPIIANPRALHEPPKTINQPITICVGSDRGFTESESAIFESNGFFSTSLGVRTLKVEQAVPALIGKISSMMLI
jgi:RsmE family RNA methyltransferase